MKVYRANPESESRYSSAKCIGTDITHVSGVPDPKHISTSYVERQNHDAYVNAAIHPPDDAFSK